METLAIIKGLQAAATEIRNLFLNKIPKWQRDPKTYDKVRYGFVEGSNDGWYKPTEVHFGAWCGVYGDSSTYREFNIDESIFKKHFLNYLNVNKKEIMLAIANSIESEAKGLADKAQSELNTELNKLKELTVS
jgi:hypothetical protein